jgi:hypothetical protein
MRYYDLKRHWTRKIEPHLADPRVSNVLVRDFNKFTFGRWNTPFTHGQYPHEFESCDWWIFHRGPMPRFWKYVKHSACHWLVNFNLRLAQLVEPEREWRIVTSEKHSTVWDGDQTLFDFNFLAMGVAPDECFALADVEHLPPGKELKIHFAEHFSVAA